MDIVSDDEVDGRNNTFSAGEGGYSDDEDDEVDGAEEEAANNDDLDSSAGEEYPEERIDFGSVVQRIRTTCNLPEVLVPRKSNKVGYEKMRRPEPAPITSILLPWSDSVTDKRARASKALQDGRLAVERGSRIFKPPNAKQIALL